ncbi:MAG: 4Fe-4S dicluster domain-containing protein [Candidatus Lokiarchaeota archaeon]|nr:4Fe-4S dicluster domain-containing protein [Candidatus Lokiarchaeota archaeon]
MDEKTSKNYHDLQQHLDKMPIGFPSTKSGIEFKILKRFFTEKQARIAKYLDWRWEPIEKIHKRAKDENIKISELEVILEKMVESGTINYKVKEGKKLYANAPIVVGMYEYQLAKLDKDLVKDFFKYIREAFGFEILSTKVSQLRVVPIEQSITPEKGIAIYDDIRNIIRSSKPPIAVADCICKKGTELIGRPCKITNRREICMAVDWMAQLYIDQGWAREITKEEALEILFKNEEEGLILQVENTENPTYFCGCCTCCCGMTAGLKNLYRPTEFVGTNYYAKIDPELCTGCGVCVERCQMEAIKLNEGISKVKLKRCIGCGVCVPGCPAEAITLKKRKKEAVPPKDYEDLYSTILNTKKKLMKSS